MCRAGSCHRRAADVSAQPFKPGAIGYAEVMERLAARLAD
jgi:hypothetical protein